MSIFGTVGTLEIFCQLAAVLHYNKRMYAEILLTEERNTAVNGVFHFGCQRISSFHWLVYLVYHKITDLSRVFGNFTA